MGKRKQPATRPTINVTPELILALRQACCDLTLVPDDHGIGPQWELAAILSAHAEALLLATGREPEPGLCMACGIVADHEPWCCHFLDGIDDGELSQDEADRVADELLSDIDF